MKPNNKNTPLETELVNSSFNAAYKTFLQAASHVQSQQEGIQASLAQLATDIEDETTNRTNADSQLDAKIETEKGQRQSDVATLQSDLSTEVAARSGADTAIRNTITAIAQQLDAELDAINATLENKQNKLNSSQLAAVNSGITASKVQAYDGYADEIASKQGALTAAQLAAVNSGMDQETTVRLQNAEQVIEDYKSVFESHEIVSDGTMRLTPLAVQQPVQSDKVVGYDSEGNLIAIRQVASVEFPHNAPYLKSDNVGDAVAGELDDTPTADSDNLVTSGVVKAALDTKQNKLNTAQMNAVNSGITSEKVTQIDTNTSAIAGLNQALEGKQDNLTTAQLAAVNSGIDETKVTQIQTNADDIDALETAVAGKQDALTAQTAYTNKGSATKVPKISTNALGQVTSITEVTITQPTALSQLSEDATHRTVTDTEKSTWNGKQDALVSGTNIKTVNGVSILGSGDIPVSGGGGLSVESFTTKTAYTADSGWGNVWTGNFGALGVFNEKHCLGIMVPATVFTINYYVMVSFKLVPVSGGVAAIQINGGINVSPDSVIYAVFAD